MSQLLELDTGNHDVRLATASDDTLMKLTEAIENGFPSNKHNLDPELRKYYQYKDKISTFDGVILYNDRIVVPLNLKDKILQSLHAAHQGISQMT